MKKNSFRLLLKVLFAIIAIILLILSAIYYTHIYINNYIRKKAFEHKITISSSQNNANGTFSFKNLILPIDASTNITVGNVKLTPSFLSMQCDLVCRDVVIHNTNKTLTIPSVFITGLTPNHIKSQFKLAKYTFKKLIVPLAILKIEDTNPINIENITIKDFNGYKIRQLAANTIYGSYKVNNNKFNQITFHISNPFITDINVNDLLLIKNLNAGSNINHLFENLGSQQVNIDFKNNDIPILNIGCVSSLIGASKFENIDSELFKDIARLKQSGDFKEIISKIISCIKQIGGNFSGIYVKSPKINLAIKAMQIGIWDWQKIIPYKIVLNIDNFQINSFKEVTYKPTPISTKIAINYSPENKALALEPFSLSISPDLLASLYINLNNVSKDIFALDMDAIQNLDKTAFIQKLSLEYSTTNIIDKLSDIIAGNSDITHDDVKGAIVTILQKSPALVLNNKAIGDPIGKNLVNILQNPHKGKITITPKNKQNISLYDCLLEKDYDSIISKINLQLDNKVL